MVMDGEQKGVKTTGSVLEPKNMNPREEAAHPFILFTDYGTVGSTSVGRFDRGGCRMNGTSLF